MSTITLDPYIYFNGTCREAMEFYKGIFGGELMMQTYAEAHMTEDESKNDWLMHASLRGGDVTLMASDTVAASPEAKKIELSLSGDDDAKLRTIFEGLSAGGVVDQQLEKQFWGDVFGHFTDKYGVIWMVNISTSKE